MIPKINSEQEKRPPRLYGLTSLTSIISLIITSCGGVPGSIDTAQVPPDPTEASSPVPNTERFIREGIGTLVENEYTSAGTDFAVLSKYLESIGYTVETAQEQWSSQSIQFQGETVHAVEATAETGERLFIMTLAGEGKTVMVTTIKGMDVNQDTGQVYDKIWTQQNFPMDEFLHLWGNVPKETQDRIIEEIFGTSTPGIPDESAALRFVSGHFLLLAYPDGNGSVIRDSNDMIAGFDGGSLAFVGKDSTGNPIFEIGQRKLVWMPFIQGGDSEPPKIINALFQQEQQPDVLEVDLAKQLSSYFGVEITGFEKTDAGFYAMSNSEHMLIFSVKDNKWQFFSLYTWESRDRVALNAPDTTVPYLNPETGLFDQIIDGSPDKVFATWNKEEGKWVKVVVEVSGRVEIQNFIDTAIPAVIKDRYTFDLSKPSDVELVKSMMVQYQEAVEIGENNPPTLPDGTYFGAPKTTNIQLDLVSYAFRTHGHFQLVEDGIPVDYTFVIYKDMPKFMIVNINNVGFYQSLITSNNKDLNFGVSSTDSLETVLGLINGRTTIFEFVANMEQYQRLIASQPIEIQVKVKPFIDRLLVFEESLKGSPFFELTQGIDRKKLSIKDLEDLKLIVPRSAYDGWQRK